MNAADRREEALASQTLRFYDSNAQLYADQTRAIDLTHLYKPFLANVPNAGRILDYWLRGRPRSKALLRILVLRQLVSIHRKNLRPWRVNTQDAKFSFLAFKTSKQTENLMGSGPVPRWSTFLNIN